MKNKKIIILCITAIVLIISGLLYFSYGFYLTNITGTENSKKLLSLTKVFKFEFSDGTEKLVSNNTNFIPGSVIEKTFTITNKSTEGIYFNIDLDEVTNTFTRTSDIVYEIYYNNEIISSNTFPTTNSSIATNLYIEKDGVREYTLKVKYLNSEENQISDMGKSISANILFSRTDSPITKFNILGNSYQAIGNGNNLFDERLMEGFGWTKCDDGSYYVENNRNVYQKKLWENTDDYTGQVKIDFLVKYSKGSAESGSGTFLRIMYKDGTSETVLLLNNFWIADKWYSPDYHTISNKSKVIDYIDFCYGTGSNKTWMKKIMITKDINSTSYEKYGTSPAPDNPSEIESLGNKITDNNNENYGKYKLNLKSVGTNIFDYDNVSQASHISKKVFTNTLEDGSVLEEKGYYVKGYNGIYISTYETLQNYIGKTVTISFDLITGEDGDFLVYPYQTNGIGIRFASKKISVKANETNRIEATGVVSVLGTVGNYSKGQIIIYKNGYTNSYTVKNVQFQFGEKATEYEPYEEKKYDAYLSEPLRCVGNTCDYIDLVNKKVVRNVYKGIFDGTESWTIAGTTNTNYQTFYTRKYLNNVLLGKREALSNKFSNVTDTSIWSATSAYKIQTGLNDKVAYISLPKSIASDATQAKTFFSNNNTEYHFILATPTEENISLPDVSEFNGKTLIASDGNLYSSKIEKE